MVAQQGRVTVAEVQERFGVSGVTARGDLDALEGAGEVIRSHGGAVSASIPQAPLDEAQPDGAAEEIRMARAAVASMVPDETVILCPGAVTNEMARMLCGRRGQRATVTTNSLAIAGILKEATHIAVVMLGGLYRPASGSFAGPHAEQMMNSLWASRCFLNAPGVSLEAGVTTTDVMEAHLYRRMMEAASQVTVLAEGRSLGTRNLAVIAPMERVNRVICDQGAAGEDLAGMRALGVDVVMV
jgi:DeoR family transcriptional regulator of aga operon